MCKSLLVAGAVCLQANGRPCWAQDTAPQNPALRQLSAAAEAHGLNIVLYGAPPPTEEIANPYAGKTDALSQVVGAAQAYGWSTLSREKLFILWPEPKLSLLAEYLRAGHGYGPVALTRPEPAILNDLYEVIQDRTKAKPETAPDAPLDISTLGPQLGQEVLAVAQNRLLRGISGREDSSLWLHPDIWEASRLVYRPATGGLGSHATIVATAAVSDEGGIARLDLDLLTGGVTSRRVLTDAPQDVWQVKRPKTSEDRERPIIIRAAPMTTGPLIPGPGGKVVLKRPMKSQTLGQLVSELQTLAGVPLQVAPSLNDEPLSCELSGLELNGFLSVLERTCSARWISSPTGSLVLTPLEQTPFETALDRMGDLRWYRFGHNNEAAWRQRLAEFNNSAATLINGYGEGILNAPGLPMKSLPEDAAVVWRKRVEDSLVKEILRPQLAVRSLGHLPLTVRYSSAQGLFRFEIGGQTKFILRTPANGNRIAPRIRQVGLPHP